MIDFGTHGVWHYGGVGLWTFILLIILIGSFFSYLKTRSRNDVIREALKSGQSLDPKILEELSNNENRGGLIVAGLVTMAVATGLVFMGYQISKSEGDTEVFEIMKGVAAIPGLVGIALFVSGLFQALTRKRN